MQPDLVLVVDYGAQYAQLIARRVREAHVYSEIVAHTTPVAQIATRRPKAVILSGGPASVYEPGAPRTDPALFEIGVPVFGICYGFQAMTQALGGEVADTGHSEFGRTQLQVGPPGILFRGLAGGAAGVDEPRQRGNPGAGRLCHHGRTAGAPVAAFEDVSRGLAGVQFHPEVLHTAHGQVLLERFLFDIAKVRPQWTEANIIDDQVAAIRSAVAASGSSADYPVASTRRWRRRWCSGRWGASSPVSSSTTGCCAPVRPSRLSRTSSRPPGSAQACRCPGTVPGRARRVTDPEEKRKIIGREFIRAFRAGRARGGGRRRSHGEQVEFLVRARSTPTSSSPAAAAARPTIKSHHNVGGLPSDLRFSLIEPLRWLFKDEVRRVGEQLGLPADLVWRQPFPGPGLGIRIIGAVTAARLDVLRRADAIARAELSAAGLDREIWQCPVVLLADIRSVGVQGDGRTYGHPSCCARCPARTP
jgi:GMP synthase (glutamine-hydrolysing)